ncbi:hypothetical protein CHU98_g1717 [Xylaria longipes]|nr:hypothetical protein CHU98_g1717 [Xylaria longipes]
MFTPNQSPHYTDDEDINWSQTCWLPAACLIHPQSTVEVVIAPKVITAIGAKFSICGGGPSMAATAAPDVELYIQYHEHFLNILDTTEAAFAANLSYTIQPAQQTLNALDGNLRSIAKSRGKLMRYQFMNDASFMQTVLDSYGSDNLARLRSVAAHYDPTVVFQEIQNDGFLLRKI